jgi:Anthranilate/para-aminobenzoate synthases component II
MSSIKVVMVDNYDSFTYNLVQYLGELGADVTVVRNDQVTVEDIEKLAPDKLVISPALAHQKKQAYPLKPS